MEEEGGTLQRRQPFERQHQGDRGIDAVVDGDRLGRVEEFDDRFGQPRTDIAFAPAAGRFQDVEAEPRHHPGEVGARLRDVVVHGGVPAQIGVLHHVLGVGERAQHAIGMAGQMLAMALECGRGCRHGFALAQAAFAAFRGTSFGWTTRNPTARRFHVLMVPMRRLRSTSSVGLNCAAACS